MHKPILYACGNHHAYIGYPRKQHMLPYLRTSYLWCSGRVILAQPPTRGALYIELPKHNGATCKNRTRFNRSSGGRYNHIS